MPVYKNSRYANSILVREPSGKLWISGRDLITKRNFRDNIYHIWNKTDRYDILSQKYWGTPSYWWVIPEFNDKLHFFDVPNEGEVIVLPSLKTLVGVLL